MIDPKLGFPLSWRSPPTPLKVVLAHQPISLILSDYTPRYASHRRGGRATPLKDDEDWSSALLVPSKNSITIPDFEFEPVIPMPPFVFAASKTALITGGASGIGLAVAKKCLGHGMKILIVDNDDDFLASARRSLGEDKVLTAKADVSRLENWAHLKKRVDSDFQDILTNLARPHRLPRPQRWDPAFFRVGRPLDLSNNLQRNLFGVINGIATFKSAVSSSSSPSSSTAIVITGSKQGITNPPGNPAYNASKSAVKTFAEHLSYDLRDSSSNTSVFFLLPGWTFTSLGRSEEERTWAEKPAAAWTPEQVADYLEAKMAKDEFYVMCPDNEVTEAMDAKRMLWAAEDVVQRRPALSRWRKEYEEEFEAWVRS
ncbi:short-chain dehydrogenase/reductase [Colletotrichum nymphaeae SA-01]|uniref:Short-chain dehydrogenase/reductase n=1 Tax=Colletotrichum nymphaeae SA-01 TaxID=1460502 RepID=A0A135UKV8_9PEZI|nr:short-chain dehydrogenase/reductase [Colletotrichum nymphaeae SA-01]